MFSQLWLRVTWLEMFLRIPRLGKKMLPSVGGGGSLFYREHSPCTTRSHKCVKFYREHFLFYKFCCKYGSFWIIGLNEEFSPRGQLKMAAILKVQLTSIFANIAENAPQDVPFLMNHVTFHWQRKGCVSIHPYAKVDYAQATRWKE